MEIWKDIKGYEGDYQVSSYGRVKSYKNGKEKILKPRLTTRKYLQVHFCKNKIVKNFQVHRLVALAFLPNPQNFPHINHKDENKMNNNLENLEWCDAKYNNNYGNHGKRISESLGKKIDQYTLDGKFVKEWESTMECERNGYDHSNVAACCRGKRKTYKGFIWSYNKF